MIPSSSNRSSYRKEEYYDDIYFDTDEEYEEDQNNDEDLGRSPGIGLIGQQPKRSSSKVDRRIPSNDELLYDPEMDDRDEAWVIGQIQKAAPPGKARKEARTDAVLTCPMCFSPLCYSCQRHERYANQYRAMFVTNCKVIRTERYRYAPSQTRRKNQKAKKKEKQQEEKKEEEESDESYYVVKCSTCDTHVAMMDEDEVYHFFNVIAT